MTVLGIVTTILPVLMELVTPRMVQFIIDQGIRAGDMTAVWQGSGIMLLAAILGAGTTIGQGIARAQISQGIAFDLRNDLFRHIQRFSFANLDRMQTGQLMTRVSSDVDVARMFLSAGMALLLRTLLMVIGSLAMMLVIDWRLGLIMVAMLIISGSVIFWFLRVVGPLFSIVQQKLGKLNTLVQENLAGVHVVKAFVREQYEIENFDRDNVDYMEQNIKVGRYLALVMPVLLVLTNLGATIAIWRGGIDVIGGRLTIGELVAFSNYMLIGMSPLLLLSNILSMISRAEASSKRVVEVLDTEPAIQPPPTPAVITEPAGDISFEKRLFSLFRFSNQKRPGSRWLRQWPGSCPGRHARCRACERADADSHKKRQRPSHRRRSAGWNLAARLCRTESRPDGCNRFRQEHPGQPYPSLLRHRRRRC